ncbi:hypothetical protein O6H91_09G095500 [Diphasiastrum complanatum]|uniref:Uncharacterized protein n=1 Tax=Diphasiastrum complanatum TaxID=34168 RepID=A0ACC2CT54_DIPCM|nr:hypothetical protein O6H91_09G095500 [Diphasiastrum complanatum]
MGLGMWHIVTDVQSIDGQMCNQSIKIHKQLHDRFLVCYMSVSKVLICFGINRHFLNSLSLAAREKTFNANSLTARSVKVFNTNLVTGIGFQEGNTRVCLNNKFVKDSNIN